jgi:hypothetical protein
MLNSAYEKFLLKVASPAQYVGGEINSAVKSAAKFTFALGFPDLYTVGMSNLGWQILREATNALPDCRADRVFLPAPDMEAELRAADLPLCGLDTGMPLRDCAAVGVSIPCELHAAGLVALLDLGGIPPLAADRSDTVPLVLAGGHVTFKPEIFAGYRRLSKLTTAKKFCPKFCRSLLRLIAPRFAVRN